MRLINADHFKKRVMPKCKFPDSLEFEVDSEPTVDAVPVVRCKDCEMHGDVTKGYYCCISKGANFYCADGRKREENVLIDREELKSLFEPNDDMYRSVDIRHLIETSPTVDAVPVRHGHWIQHKEIGTPYRYECSECSGYHRALYNFCPTCGANMMEEKQDGKDD